MTNKFEFRESVYDTGGSDSSLPDYAYSFAWRWRWHVRGAGKCAGVIRGAESWRPKAEGPVE
jgi:hypothetical protein